MLFQIDSVLSKVQRVSRFLIHGANLPAFPFPVLHLHLTVVKCLLTSNLSLSQTPTSHIKKKKAKPHIFTIMK